MLGNHEDGTLKLLETLKTRLDDLVRIIIDVECTEFWDIPNIEKYIIRVAEEHLFRGSIVGVCRT
jgi:hypothetical protein